MLVSLPPGFARGYPYHADGGDSEQVEGGGPDDGARAQRLRLEVVPDNADDRQQDLRGRRS